MRSSKSTLSCEIAWCQDIFLEHSDHAAEEKAYRFNPILCLVIGIDKPLPHVWLEKDGNLELECASETHSASWTTYLKKTLTRARRHDTCPEASSSVGTGQRCLELAHQVSGHSSTTQIVVFANSGGPSQAVVPRFQRKAIRYPVS